MQAQLYSKVDFGYPSPEEMPSAVRECYDSVPEMINLFRTLAHSTGSFVAVMGMVDAVFKRLTLNDLDKELLVMLTGARRQADYEWDQHVSISQALGASPEQLIAIAEYRTSDEILFSPAQRSLLSLGEAVLRDGYAPGVIVNRARLYYSKTEVADAVVILGFYTLVSFFMRTFQIPSDPKTDGTWIKR